MDNFRDNDNITKFRTASNQLIVRNLFYEVARDRQGNWPDPDTVLYTLGREDITENGKTYQSLYKYYMEVADITEFEFANKFFESYQHWKKICETTWMQPVLAEWREELELSIRSMALNFLIEKSSSTVDVAKYLLNNNWVEKLHETNAIVNLRGRPSKQDIKNHLTLITNQSLQEQQDYERIKNL